MAKGGGIKAKGSLTTSGSVTKRGKGGGTTTAPTTTKLFDVPPVPEPAAQVGVTIGFTMARNYQSVKMDVHVSLPWDPADVQGGLEEAMAQADTFIAENAHTLDTALETLGERAG